jgi:hypothetical protein
MSKPISQILNHPERAVAKAIAKLEDKNGYPSHDVRLTAENIQKVRSKLAELNLDPDDTTGEELYQALMVRFQEDSRRFDEHFGMHAHGFDEKSSKAFELVSKNADLPERWVMKASWAKSLLRQHPPKRVMKQLHYRSIDSMLKRENLAEIYLGIEFIESPTWNKAHFKLASSLESTAFERRPVILASLASDKWGLTDGEPKGAYSNDYGVLGVLPTNKLSQISLLSLVVMLIDELSSFGQIKLSEIAAKLSPAAAWWSETDCLMANLAGEPVSLNLKDVADCHVSSASYKDRISQAGQKSFWRELLSRYENQIGIDEDNLPRFEDTIKNIGGVLTNQPAFEYVEDI